MRTLDFSKFRPIYPPRPKGAIPPESLGRYRGFVAQYKYHDIRTLVYVFPNRRVELLNRHQQPHKLYRLTEEMTRSILSLDLAPGKFHVFDGGLMHGKTSGLRDVLILWDILVHDGRYLLGSTYRERYELLREACGDPKNFETVTGNNLGLAVSPRLWLAPLFTSDLESRYRALIHLDEVEGLVLKDPNGKLERGLREENNGNWQIRVRKPNTNYTY